MKGMGMGKLHKDGRINFGVCYMNERYKWGYEVVDTIDNFRICSNFGFKTMEEARKEGFAKAKQIIDELECSHDGWEKCRFCGENFRGVEE